MKRGFFPAGEVGLDVPEALRPSTLRRLGIKPGLDLRIDGLDLPAAPWWRRLSVLLLRAYRRIRPAALGNRCVFEPSCSRYSELAFRTQTFPTAVRLTLLRLHRCRPGQGGLDIDPLELSE